MVIRRQLFSVVVAHTFRLHVCMLMCLVDKKASQIRLYGLVYTVDFVWHLYLRLRLGVLCSRCVGEADQGNLTLDSG